MNPNPRFEENPIVKKFNNRIALFFPYNGDYINRNYDVENEEHGENRENLLAHEVFDDRVYDGLLVAKSHISDSKIDVIAENGGLKKYLRIDKSKHYHPLMGDCGAPRYINEKFPTWTVEQLYNYYETLGFDFGIGLDHIITEFNNNIIGSKESQRRFGITVENNIELLKMVKERNANFYLMGSVQGWSPYAYKKCVEEYAKAGFKYVALGGMVGAPDNIVGRVLSEINPIIKEANMGIHVLGITRHTLLPIYRKMNVITCDSSTHLIRAVMSPQTAYLSKDDNYYSGLVFPHSKTANRVKRYLKEPEKIKTNTMMNFVKRKSGNKVDIFEGKCRKTEEGVKLADANALKAFRDYDKGLITQSECETLVKQYLRIFDGYDPDLFGNYSKTLREQPWKNCECKMCKESGIDITFLRRSEMGSRRTFHNLWTYYQQYKKEMDRVQDLYMKGEL